MFNPYIGDLKMIAIWIPIHSLLLELYNKLQLWKMGNYFHRTLKVDKNSLQEHDMYATINNDVK